MTLLPPAMGLILSLCLYEIAFGINQTTEDDMPFNKESKPKRECLCFAQYESAQHK